MKVVYFDTETGEHKTINDVFKIVESISKLYIYYEEGCKMLAKISKDYITSITLN